MIRREINLYFASLTVSDALVLAARTAQWLCGGCRTARGTWAQELARELQADAVYLFGSARGALAACLTAAGLGPGDEVVLTGFTCLAVPTAVAAAGARPVYADINPVTLTAPLENILKVAGPRTRAVVLQHTFGYPAPIDAIPVLRERGMLVIEDCALATGTVCAGTPLGSFADASFYSLELSKAISTGWGGILAVRQPALAMRMREFYKATPEPAPWRVVRSSIQTAASAVLYRPGIFGIGKYAVAAAFRVGLFRPSTPPAEAAGDPGPAFIVRLSPPQAALGRRIWGRLSALRSRSLATAARLREALVRGGFVVLAPPHGACVPLVNRVPFLVADRARAMAWFAAHGIELGAWFDAPVSPMPPKGSPLAPGLDELPVAQRVARQIVNLPAHSRLTEDDVAEIVRVLEGFAEHCRASAVQPAQEA